MRIVRLVLPILALLLLLTLPSVTYRAQGTTFTVINTNDTGTGSLRAAILNANATAGVNTIAFNIPGGGVKVISPMSTLPIISDSVIIDGYTQPGASVAVGNTRPVILIELNGTGTTGIGLEISAGNSTVKGLSIYGFPLSVIRFTVNGGNTIVGNYFGYRADGVTTMPSNGVLFQGSSNNVVGGSTPADRNYFTGGPGVSFYSVLSNISTNNRIIGNRMSGCGPCVNVVGPGSTGNVIGGTGAGEGNVINGANIGINFEQGGNNTTILGNFIGTDETGTVAVGNLIGIKVADAGNITIGGIEPGSRNIISSSLYYGINLGCCTPINVKIIGNYIGTDVTGNLDLGNGIAGIYLEGGIDTQIGGTSVAERNVISGNDHDGIRFQLGMSATVQGNFIGTNAAGTAAIPNTWHGIYLPRATAVIGGIQPGAGNVISGNGIYGIYQAGPKVGSADKSVIQGNAIGTSLDGILPLGNGADGIYIEDFSDNVIEAGNIIAYNAGAGVTIASGVHNRISGNRIFANGDSGIELYPTGIVPNDPEDADTGPNDQQNYPVIENASLTSGNVTINGTLDSKLSAAYRIEFFASNRCNATGSGEGQYYLGFTNVSTVGGTAAYNVSFPRPGVTTVVTATATDSDGNTSEFSVCKTISGSLAVDTIGIYRPSTNYSYLKLSNTTGVADIYVTLSGLGMSPVEYRDVPVVGDWNGDGVDTVGFYRRGRVSDGAGGGTFILTNSNSTPQVDYNFVLGIANDTPIIGDWNGDGHDDVGIFRPSNGLIYLKSTLATGFADYTMVLGVPGDIGLAGDWNNDGISSPGVYRPSTGLFYLTNQICNCAVFADYYTALGIVGDQPFTGDWNGDGRTGLGVFRPSSGQTYLRNDPTTSGFADFSFVYGIPNDVAFGGVWAEVGAGASGRLDVAPTFSPKTNR